MRGLNSDTVDLIYLDPPFNSNRTYEAPVGGESAGAAFKDVWTLDDVDLAWHGEIAETNEPLYKLIDTAGATHSKGMKSYLIMMAVRVMEMHRLLKSTGSIWLHVDPTASHYLKLLMDAIFGCSNFSNEVVWCYSTGGATKKRFSRKHDIILYYGKNESDRSFNTLRQPYTSAMSRDPKHAHKFHSDGKIMMDWWADISPINPQAKERTGYPTQKPLALLDRIIKASSDVSEVVLDPFCGCATACVAAERLHREWIGIDLSPKAAELVTTRLQKEVDAGALLKPDGGLSGLPTITHRTDFPTRTDVGSIPSKDVVKRELFGKQEGHCIYCKVLFEYRNLTIDHIVAQSKGGQDHLDNIQLLCGACNSEKGAKSHEKYLAVRRTREAHLKP